MIRTFATIAVITGAALTSTSAVYASHLGYPSTHIIFGQAYYYSINFDLLFKKITGKNLKEGTFAGATVKIGNADSACSNPQLKLIAPGVGPKGIVSGTSPSVDDGDLVKDDRYKGNIYQTTTTILELVPEGERLSPPEGLCKTTSGNGDWETLFWQDRECDKGKAPEDLTDPVCYKEFAGFDSEGTLRFVTGPGAGNLVIGKENWTYVYLPTGFAFKIDLNFGETVDESIYGICNFVQNTEVGAAKPGEPYSITNPPVNGWAAQPAAPYNCEPITLDQFNSYQ